MNLSNAKLLRVDVQSIDAHGNESFAQGAALSVDCTIDGVKSGQRYQLGKVISDATAVMYLMRDKVPAGLVILKGYQVLAQLNGEAMATYVVEFKNPRVKGALSHYELFLRVPS